MTVERGVLLARGGALCGMGPKHEWEPWPIVAAEAPPRGLCCKRCARLHTPAA